VFPEATFSRSAAMLPFRLGAFRAAAESRRPVVPIVIRGTRDIMHDRRWLLRRGAIDITIGPPIETAAGGWCESLRLRREARAVIERQLATEGPGPVRRADAPYC
jgi:1-acyl-sn-glycerol-3-phosphate acyltransferase